MYLRPVGAWRAHWGNRIYEIVALLAGFTLLYSSLAGGVERSRVSGPIVFTLFGMVVGSAGLNLLDVEVEVEREFVKVLSELTLALVRG